MLLAVISSVLNVGLLLSLAFSMGIAAVVSLLIVKFARDSSVKVELKPNSQRLFKNDKFSVNSILHMTTPRWVSARFASLQGSLGIETHTEVVGENSILISIEPLFAGRHMGIDITAEVSDPLDLFEKKIKVRYSDFTIDALPISLLADVPKMKPSSLGAGESSSRFSGASVELYSLDEYKPYGETKNILWKRVGRMPDEKLIVRVREANNPQTIKIGFVNIARRHKPEDSVRFMDLVCESVGFLGNTLLAMGCSIEISHVSVEAPGSISTMEATNINELAEVLMVMCREGDVSVTQREILELVLKSDIVVTGYREVQDKNLAMLVSKRLSLLIREEETPSPAYVSEKNMIYSGHEDLRRIILKVVEK